MNTLLYTRAKNKVTKTIKANMDMNTVLSSPTNTKVLKYQNKTRQWCKLVLPREDKICKKFQCGNLHSQNKGVGGLCSLCTAALSTSALRGISTAICYTQLHIFVFFCQSFIQSQVQRNARFWNSHRALWFCESPLHLNICCFPGILRFSTKCRGVFAASLQTHSIYALPDLQWNFFW